MKVRKEHRVPLTEAALSILRQQPRFEGCELIFPSPTGKQLSDMAMTSVMRRMGLVSVPHGLRSTFRDWAAERTNFPKEIAEMALAHTVSNAVEAAYRRGDMLEKRREMMQVWADFLSMPAPQKVNVNTSVK
jgi:integrase